MFEPQNTIIIVDDNENDLITLAKAFLSSGVSCRTILYNGSYDTPLSNVRIAFFDINLLGISFDNNQDTFDYVKDKSLSAVFNGLTFAIQNCIHSENGPFALIFWSSNIKLITNFIQYVRERQPLLPSPIFIDSIDKDEFLENIDGINQRIEDIFKNKSIKLLFDFENNCKIAASQIINDLYNNIPKNSNTEDQLWSNNIGFEDNFDLIFSSIAKETLGPEYARINTDKAIYEALLPAMNYYLINHSINSNNWHTHLKSINYDQIKYPDTFKIGIFNSIFHIDNVSKVEPHIRGAVYEYKIVPLPYQIVYYFSLSKYFKKLEDYISDYFFKFNDDITEQKKKTIKEKSQFIVIEISSSCDFSQNKKRNNKYILGLKTPSFDKSYINKSKISNAVFYDEIPEFSLENEEFFLWINFNFVISNSSKIKKIGKPLFILKKELMDMIGNRYANYVSRIGITRF